MDAVAAQGLFFSKSLVLIDDPFALKESGEVVLASLKALKESVNPIAILAPKVHAAHAKNSRRRRTRYSKLMR